MQNWQSLTNIPPQDAAFEMAEDAAIPDQKTLMLVSWLTESPPKQSVTRNILDRNNFYRGVYKHLLVEGCTYKSCCIWGFSWTGTEGYIAMGDFELHEKGIKIHFVSEILV